MFNVGWIGIKSRRYGGVIYGELVRKVLSDNFNVELKIIGDKKFKFKYIKPFYWFIELFKLNEVKDLWIRDDFFTIALQSANRTKGKKLSLIYHIDLSIFPWFFKPFLFILERIFYLNLKRSDVIVTIADYWKNYFSNKGCKNIFKISSCLDLSKFNISDEEVEEFKNKYNLLDKPIIYIGNCQKAKGVLESYQALKDLDIHLITSGEEQVKIPALNLNLDYRDYLKLLKASTIVITMSRFKEGWCMTAHEAMLLKTPVIGSGLGGMRELLNGGKQMICPEFNLLREKVEYLLNHPEIRIKMGEDGYNFAKNFSIERFKKDWIELINKLV